MTAGVVDFERVLAAVANIQYSGAVERGLGSSAVFDQILEIL